MYNKTSILHRFRLAYRGFRRVSYQFYDCTSTGSTTNKVDKKVTLRVYRQTDGRRTDYQKDRTKIII